MASLNAYRYITAQQLILRPIELTDAPAVFSYTCDSRVARFTHWNPHTNLDDTIRYIAHTQQRTNTHVWGIALQDSKTLIGECSITQHENGRAELYYALAHNHWGNGYTTQALTALLTITQEVPTIGRLEAWIIRENLASCRVAEKSGLIFEQTIQDAWLIDDKIRDIDLYIR
jgi:ribosomal-protein-alanine N-acetyltransferase